MVTTSGDDHVRLTGVATVASISVALVIGILIVAWNVIYNWWAKSPLYGANRGPKVYPLVGSQVEFVRNVHRVFDWATEYLQKYPEHTIRLSRPMAGNIITTAHPANVEYMLKTNFANYPKGAQFQYAFKDLLGNGIFNADGHAWKAQRKVASFEFSTRSLRDFLVEILQDETHDRLLPFLKKAEEEGTTIDLQDIFMRFAFDTICLLGFGVDSGCLDLSLPEVEFARSFDEASRLTIRRLFLPAPIWKLKHALGLGDETKIKQAVQIIDKFAYSVIQSRRQELSSSPGTPEPAKSKFSRGQSDLLSRFIQVADQDAEEEMRKRNSGSISASKHQPRISAAGPEAQAQAQAVSDEFIRDMLINFILAGRDTSSASLTWFFWLLSKNPDVEANIRAEIQHILRNKAAESCELDSKTSLAESSLKGIHDPKWDPRSRHMAFEYDELREMHYLQAALSEALRLYPPVANDSKTALEDDVFPDGTVIHRGDRVVFHPYAMGRLESLWGTDYHDFKPERWLKDGTYVPESAFKFAVFQAGPRICLGKEMALTQMKYIAASILSCPLRIRVAPGQAFQYDLSLTLKMKDGLLVTVDQSLES